MNNMLKCALAGLCLIIPAFGQILIDWTEIPNEADTRWVKNIAYEQTVSLGSAGGPHTWAFTSQPMGSDSCVNIIKSCWQTPYWDSFPSANLCYASIEGPDTAYLYMHLAMAYLANLGIVGQDSDDVYVQEYIPPDTNNLPEVYGDVRRYSTAWYVFIDASTYIRYQKRGTEFINAYGTVNVPYGSFPCLRYVIWDTLISTVYYNSVPILYDTVNKIGHQFVAENRSGVVCVFSHENETNPYFTNAAILERMTGFYGIEETQNDPPTGCFISCRPNPFHGRIDIQFAMQDARYRMQVTKLLIYDASGKLIKNLSSDLGSGIIDHVSWNGSDQSGRKVPAGIYFVRLEAGGKTVVEKIVKTE